jgi:hypothetical protein
MPNWRFDALCVDEDLAKQVEARFRVEMRPVAWVGKGSGEARQLVLPSVGTQWFAPEQLRARAVARHGVAGETCPVCDRWRWMPIPIGELPAFDGGDVLGNVDAAASPEWFGAGHQSFRRVLFRRELAELIVAASPKDLKVVAVT